MDLPLHSFILLMAERSRGLLRKTNATASFIPLLICRPPSTASSKSTIRSQSHSSGKLTRMRSSQLSNAGTKRWNQSTRSRPVLSDPGSRKSKIRLSSPSTRHAIAIIPLLEAYDGALPNSYPIGESFHGNPPLQAGRLKVFTQDFQRSSGIEGSDLSYHI